MMDPSGLQDALRALSGTPGTPGVSTGAMSSFEDLLRRLFGLPMGSGISNNPVSNQPTPGSPFTNQPPPAQPPLYTNQPPPVSPPNVDKRYIGMPPQTFGPPNGAVTGYQPPSNGMPQGLPNAPGTNMPTLPNDPNSRPRGGPVLGGGTMGSGGGQTHWF